MQNYSTVLDQITWGIHLNFEGHFASPPNSPSWLTQLQQQDWQRRGIILWDAEFRIVTHHYAGSALELLENLQGNNAWKTNGLTIGSPAFQLSANSVSTPSAKVGGDWVLKNQIDLSTDQAQAFVEFLITQESLLKRISLCDQEDAEEALKKIYQHIAAYGRKVREGKKSDKITETTKPYILPFSSRKVTLKHLIYQI